MPSSFTRRAVLRTAAALAAGAAVGGGHAGAADAAADAVPTRPLGRTGVRVSALALGGYHLGSLADERSAVRLVHAAVDAGITFLDNAWEYHKGRSEEWMGAAIADRRDRVFLMTKVCSHGRGRAEALRQLDESLRRLRTDHLDLWQIHEVVYPDDPERHYAADGAIAALEQAKREGKTRFVGFTGHKDPAIHLDMLRRGFPFDSCQLPLNVLDGTYASFEREVLPELARRGIAAIGMKSLGGRGTVVQAGVPVEDALRYAMSLPVATTVSGIDSEDILAQNLRVARGFVPMPDAELAALRQRHSALAARGEYERYKTSRDFEGEEGRRQHGLAAG